jgi:hypothetical protein
MGATSFKAAYAAGSVSGATKTCVAKRDGGAATDLKNAANECKAERAADAAAFTKKYGTNKNGKNAYGKCVSAKARESARAPSRRHVEDRQGSLIDRAVCGNRTP